MELLGEAVEFQGDPQRTSIGCGGVIRLARQGCQPRSDSSENCVAQRTERQFPHDLKPGIR